MIVLKITTHLVVGLGYLWVALNFKKGLKSVKELYNFIKDDLKREEL